MEAAAASRPSGTDTAQHALVAVGMCVRGCGGVHGLDMRVHGDAPQQNNVARLLKR